MKPRLIVSRARCLPWLGGLLLAAGVCGPAAHAAPAAVAIAAVDPAVDGLVHCLGRALQAGGPVRAPVELGDGLEFRLGLQDGGRILTMVAFIKADLHTLRTQVDQEDDQARAQLRIIDLLRIHVGTRAWRWRPSAQRQICRDATAWVETLRREAIALDHLRADGEPAARRGGR